MRCLRVSRLSLRSESTRALCGLKAKPKDARLVETLAHGSLVSCIADAVGVSAVLPEGMRRKEGGLRGG